MPVIASFAVAYCGRLGIRHIAITTIKITAPKPANPIIFFVFDFITFFILSLGFPSANAIGTPSVLFSIESSKSDRLYSLRISSFEFLITLSSQDISISVTNSLNASHTRGLNQCRIRTTYPNIFARLSRRARCVCSWAITYSCASAKLLGKYIFGFRNPSAKGVPTTCEI